MVRSGGRSVFAEDEAGCANDPRGRSGTPVIVQGEQGDLGPRVIGQVVDLTAGVVMCRDREAEPKLVHNPADVLLAEDDPASEAPCEPPSALNFDAGSS